MLKLYDKNNNFIQTLNNLLDLTIIESLDSGDKELEFKIPITDLRLSEEQKIIYNNYIYIIKAIEINESSLYNVKCKSYYGNLNGRYISFINMLNANITDVLDVLIDNTNWSYELVDEITKKFTISFKYKTVIECLKDIANFYNIEYDFDTYNKIIKIYKQRGKYNTFFIINSSNLAQCKVKSNSENLITKLVPYGKNQLTIENVNNGIPYIENYAYTAEKNLAYYIDTKIASPQDLLNNAQEKLDKLSKPQINYELKLINFQNKVFLGDTIRIIDNIKNIDTKLRVIKKVIHPYHPKDDYIEVGDPLYNLTDIYNQSIQSINDFQLYAYENIKEN